MNTVRDWAASGGSVRNHIAEARTVLSPDAIPDRGRPRHRDPTKVQKGTTYIHTPTLSHACRPLLRPERSKPPLRPPPPRRVDFRKLVPTLYAPLSPSSIRLSNATGPAGHIIHPLVGLGFKVAPTYPSPTKLLWSRKCTLAILHYPLSRNHVIVN